MPKLKGWNLNASNFVLEGEHASSLSKGENILVFSVKSLEFDNISIKCSKVTDMFVKSTDDGLVIQSLGKEEVEFLLKTPHNKQKLSIKPGKTI